MNAVIEYECQLIEYERDLLNRNQAYWIGMRLSEYCYISATILDLLKKQKELGKTRDKFERTVFHAAVEKKPYTLVHILLSSDTNCSIHNHEE